MSASRRGNPLGILLVSTAHARIADRLKPGMLTLYRRGLDERK